MNIRKGLTRKNCEFLCQECNFTEEEKAVFRFLVCDRPRTYMADRLNVSLSTIDRRIRSVKRKVNSAL